MEKEMFMSEVQPSILPSKNTYNFVEEWTAYANEKGRDLFFKFFCYFLAFNHLYDCDYLWDDEDYNLFCSEKSVKEIEKVVAFLKHVLISENGPKLDVVVSDNDYNVLCSVQWRNPKTGDWELDDPDQCRAFAHPVTPREKTLLAMTKVYRVRCNLFHGEKRMTMYHDRELVESSNNLLGVFLRECIHNQLAKDEGLSLEKDNA